MHKTKQKLKQGLYSRILYKSLTKDRKLEQNKLLNNSHNKTTNKFKKKINKTKQKVIKHITHS